MELASRTWGDGARALLWIHGYAMDSSLWQPLWELLPEYRHVGVDLPGHGGSSALPVEGAPAMADAVLATATKTGTRDLVAMSFGGLVGIQAAMQAERGWLSTLVLASPALGGGPQDADSLTLNVELINMVAERGVGPWVVDRWMTCPPRIFEGASRQPALYARLRAVAERHAFRELQTGSMAPLMNQVHGGRELARIDARTLVMVGEDDMEAFKRIAELIRRGVRGCVRQYLPGAGHVALLERPAEAAARLRAFLEAVPAAAT